MENEFPCFRVAFFTHATPKLRVSVFHLRQFGDTGQGPQGDVFWTGSFAGNLVPLGVEDRHTKTARDGDET